MTHSPLGPTLETDRLILRPPVDADFDSFCAFHADAEAMTWLGGLATPPVVWRIMRTIAGSWALDGFGMFSVIEKNDWSGRAAVSARLAGPRSRLGPAD